MTSCWRNARAMTETPGLRLRARCTARRTVVWSGTARSRTRAVSTCAAFRISSPVTSPQMPENPSGAIRRVDGMVDFDDHERNAGAVKDARGRLSAAAVAGDDYVVAERFGERLDRRGGRRGPDGGRATCGPGVAPDARRAATAPS